MEIMHVEMKGAVMVTSPEVKRTQEAGEAALRKLIGDEEANALIANRTARDGAKAHVTLAGPGEVRAAIASRAVAAGSKGAAEREFRALAEGLAIEVGDFEACGLGRAVEGDKIAYYVVLFHWTEGRGARVALGLDAKGQDFHVTVGFGPTGDVHGVRKNVAFGWEFP
jgi:hypothetical protein